MIHRTTKKEHFTQIDNGLLRATDLSLTAKGLLSYMLSFPDDWKFTVKDLEQGTDTKRTKLMTALEELEKAHLVERKISRVNGKFVVDFDIYESPSDGSMYDSEGYHIAF